MSRRHLQQQQQHISSSSSSARRLRQVVGSGVLPTGVQTQQQSVAALAILPKFFIGNVKTSLANNFSWKITRDASASGAALTANAYDRQQIGYTLTFTKQLDKREFTLEGTADLTNPSATDPINIQSLTLYAGTKQLDVACGGLPGRELRLGPTQQISCPFSLALPSDPGAGSLTGFAQTRGGRRQAELAVPFSFAGCSSSGSAGGSGGCSVRDVGSCVAVTDGSYIINKYKDIAGTQLAGNITRSQLFAVGDVRSSTQGPPRQEPTLPAAASPAAVAASAAAQDEGPPNNYLPEMPTNNWWNRRLAGVSSSSSRVARRRVLLSGLLGDALGWLASTSDSGAHSTRRRHLLQTPLDKATLDKNFDWPIPTITGERPPVGLNGVPANARDKPREICGTTVFSYGMIFGPLMPTACGTYEVQSTAAAKFVDGSRKPITSGTYAYLQVICPLPTKQQPVQDTAGGSGSSPGNKAAGFLSTDQAAPGDPASTADQAAGGSEPAAAGTDAAAAPAAGDGSSTSTAAPAPAADAAATAADATVTSTTPSVTPPPADPVPVPAAAAAAAVQGGSAGGLQPRISAMVVSPVSFSSSAWSLSSSPLQRSFPDGTAALGCKLSAAPAAPASAPTLTGSFRLGNPVAGSDPGAATLALQSISVVAVVTSGIEGAFAPVVVPADCRGADAAGLLQLMPKRRTTCTFELQLPLATGDAAGVAAGTPRMTGPLSGTVVATVTLAEAGQDASSGGSGGTQVSGEALPFNFPYPLPSAGVSVGACARLWSGVTLANALPVGGWDSSGAASGSAFSALNGTSGSCANVCGPSDVEVLAVVNGFTTEQCGSYVVSCLAAVIPDNNGWDGIAKLQPAALTTVNTFAVAGSCKAPGFASTTGPEAAAAPAEVSGPPAALTVAAVQPGPAAAPAAAAALMSSSAEAPAANVAGPSGSPVQLLLQGVNGSRAVSYNWKSSIVLLPTGSASPGPAAAPASPAGVISIARGGSQEVRLRAKHKRSEASRAGRVTGQVVIQPADDVSSVVALPIPVSGVSVTLLLACGGAQLFDNIPCSGGGQDNAAGLLALGLGQAAAQDCPGCRFNSLNCSFELPGIDLQANPIVGVFASAKVPLAGSAAPGLVTVQSAPASVVLSSAALQETGRCVGVSSSFALKPTVASVDPYSTNAQQQPQQQTLKSVQQDEATGAASAATPAGGSGSVQGGSSTLTATTPSDAGSAAGPAIDPAAAAAAAAADLLPIPEPRLAGKWQLPSRICGSQDIDYVLTLTDPAAAAAAAAGGSITRLASVEQQVGSAQGGLLCSNGLQLMASSQLIKLPTSKRGAVKEMAAAKQGVDGLDGEPLDIGEDAAAAGPPGNDGDSGSSEVASTDASFHVQLTC